MTTVLVVDDRAPGRELLVALLSGSGMLVIEACDGAEALRLAKSERPNLIITDILMPVMDGYEMVRQLRADPAIASTPVIFYSAHYLEREAQTLAKQCDVSYILTKPTEPEVILRTVSAALGLAPLPVAPTPPEMFDREHSQVLMDKLSAKVRQLEATTSRMSDLIALGQQLGVEHDPLRLLEN